MVTAIVIPIICLYFYWLTKKELKENYKEWIALENITEEATISGKILKVTEQKERFYYHRYNHVITIKIQANNKQFNVKKITPIRKGNTFPHVQEGEEVLLYGNWMEGYFRINRIIKS